MHRSISIALITALLFSALAVIPATAEQPAIEACHSSRWSDTQGWVGYDCGTEFAAGVPWILFNARGLPPGPALFQVVDEDGRVKSEIEGRANSRGHAYFAVTFTTPSTPRAGRNVARVYRGLSPQPDALVVEMTFTITPQTPEEALEAYSSARGGWQAAAAVLAAMRLGDLDRAEQYAERLSTGDRKEYAWYFGANMLVTIAVRRGDMDKAITTQRMVAKENDQPGDWANLVHLLLRACRVGEAESVAKDAYRRFVGAAGLKDIFRDVVEAKERCGGEGGTGNG